MRKPVVALLVVAIAAVTGFGVWAAVQEDEPPTFCRLDAWTVDPPPGHEGAEVSTEDGGTPGPDDDCDADPVPEPIDGVEHLRLGFDCAFRDVDGEVVGHHDEPNLPGGLCGKGR